MTPPKIYIRKDPCTGVLAESWQEEPYVKYDTVFYSEEHVRAIANELYNNGDAFIAKLNGKSFSEYLKGEPND